MKNNRIFLSPPDIGQQEKEYVEEAFSTNWIAPLGPHVDAFEKEISEVVGGSQYTAVLSSGTAALHLALIQLEIKSNDYVIAQSFTFCGSVNPIKYLGAHPVLIDSEEDTWNMDPVLLENAIKELAAKNIKPKAIIYVHLYGMPAKVDEIQSIASFYDIPLIEDAAEALGSRYNNKAVGNFGNYSILSFNGNKIITTGGGGALLSSVKKDIEKTRFLATQARDPAPYYQHSEIGYNYRLSNVAAAIGRGQLASLDKKVARRRAIFEFYHESFKDFDFISFHEEPEATKSNRWLTCILLNDEKIIPDAIRQALEKENIESRPFWKPMHLQPVFGNEIAYVNGVSEDLFKRGLCLPSGSGMSDLDVERVAGEFKKILEKVGRK